MIGFYDYTVILTYLSLLSAVTGIGLAVAHHPLLAILCLMFSGLCDMFDGRVAARRRTARRSRRASAFRLTLCATSLPSASCPPSSRSSCAALSGMPC